MKQICFHFYFHVQCIIILNPLQYMYKHIIPCYGHLIFQIKLTDL